jgi:glucosylceramidase
MEFTVQERLSSLRILLTQAGRRKYGAQIVSVVLMAFVMSQCTPTGKPATVGQPLEYWVTTGDQQQKLTKQQQLFFKDTAWNESVIAVDTATTYQTMDGFGYTLTGGSAYHIWKLNPEKRAALLKELFSSGPDGIGISYLRISIGSSDLNDHPFTYNDLPKGKTDPTLQHFDLGPDAKDVLPVLKEIVAINPSLKILGSPWSAPAWMKTNESLKGGSLKPAHYDIYARYLVTYLQTMIKNGIALDAITLQNEPENPKNNPSMVMTATEQATFIKNFIGPQLQQAGLKTKIILFDHNCDHPEYPITVLQDTAASKYVDGSAFHLYLGTIDALSKVHDQSPNKNLYFTEQWTSAEGKFDGDLRWHTKNLIIGAPRNWSKNVLEWNLAADFENKPFTDSGGCDRCLGAITIGDSIRRNVSYYIIGHASKFVPDGSVRIASDDTAGLPNVAYLTPAKKKVLIVLNDTNAEKVFAIKHGNKIAKASLPAGAVATFVW